MPRFPVSFIVAYLFRVYKSSNSYASLVVTHAALKRFHSFGVSNEANPLDGSICHNFFEASRRSKPYKVKKAPIQLRLLEVLLISLLVLQLI